MFFIKEKSYNDIIEEIKSKLTEDKKENISYLKKQAKKYKNHKMNEAILKEIGKLLFENLNTTEQEELSIALALYKNITEVSTAVSNLIKLAEVSENIPDRRRFLNTLSEMRSKAIVLKQTRSACIEDLEDTYPGISRDEVEKGKDEIKRLVRKKEYRPNRRG